MLGVIGIILSLALLMVLAYKGWPVILLAPVLALLAASFALLQGDPYIFWRPTLKYSWSMRQIMSKVIIPYSCWVPSLEKSWMMRESQNPSHTMLQTNWGPEKKFGHLL